MDDATVLELIKFKQWVDQLYRQNLALFKKAISLLECRGNSAKYETCKADDNNYETYFAADDSVTTAAIEIELGKPLKINGFILQGYMPLGQRVDQYSIECRVDGKWTSVFPGKNLGNRCIVLEGRVSAKDILFPVAEAVRLRINKAAASPRLNNFQVIRLHDKKV